MAKLFVVLAVLLSLVVVAGCSRETTNESTNFEAEYDAHEYGPGGSAVSDSTRFYEGSKSVKVSYDGSACPATPPGCEANRGAVRLMYTFDAPSVDGYEGFYNGAYYFPKDFGTKQKGYVELLRWDNGRAYGATGDKGGVAITGVIADGLPGPDNLEGRLFRGGINDVPGSAGFAFIGDAFEIPVGRWASITVHQKIRGPVFSSGEAINEVSVNGRKVLDKRGASYFNSQGRGFDRLVWGLPQLTATEQAGTALSFWFDRAYASLEGPPPPARPNVLVIVTDDQRFGTTSPTWMPKLRKWFREGETNAAGEVTTIGGTAFQNAFVTTPECCPSRGSIMTGQYPHNHGLEQQDVKDLSQSALDAFQAKTLQRYLDSNGYFTGAFGKFLNGWDIEDAVDESGADTPLYFDRYSISNTGSSYCGFRVYERLTGDTTSQTRAYGSPEPSDPDEGCASGAPYSTTHFSTQAQNFIQEAESNDGAPWFLYIAPHAPHDPAVPEYDFRNEPTDVTTRSLAYHEDPVTDKHPYVQDARAKVEGTASASQLFCCTTPGYPGEAILDDRRDDQMKTLKSVDRMVDQVFTKLRDTGEENNTLAIFVSDNGYIWGEHWLEGKLTPYTFSVRVPMFMRWPGHVDANSVESRQVANIDIAATVMDSLEPTISPTTPVDGKSLLDARWLRDYLLLEYKKDPDVHAAENLPSWASLRSPNWQYIRYDPLGSTGVFREYYTDLPNMKENLYGDGTPDPGPDGLLDTADDPVPVPDTKLNSALSCAGSSCP